MVWKLGRNETAREQDKIIPFDLGTVGYIILIRSPDIHTDNLQYLYVLAFRLQEAKFLS